MKCNCVNYLKTRISCKKTLKLQRTGTKTTKQHRNHNNKDTTKNDDNKLMKEVKKSFFTIVYFKENGCFLIEINVHLSVTFCV